MNIDQQRALDQVKECFSLTLKERSSLQKDSLFYPSKIWHKANKLFSYLRYLPAEELESIRIHTTPVTGSPVLDFAYHPVRDADEETKLNTFWAASQYNTATEALPNQYWISEPTPNAITESVCLPFRNKLISNDLVRYQRFITNLYNLGILNDLEGREQKTILEIGTGYGALPYQLSNILGENTCYILVDLPELLFWAAVYVTINKPDARIFVYNPALHRAKLSQEQIAEYDFLFIPNYKLMELLGDVPIHLGINLLSFQEMTERQVRFYCDYVSRNLEGGFFGSDNMDIHAVNSELHVSTDSIIREYFDIIPSESDFSCLRQGFTSELWQVYSFFGIARDSNTKMDVVNPVVHGVNYKFHFKEIDYWGSSIVTEEQGPERPLETIEEETQPSKADGNSHRRGRREIAAVRKLLKGMFRKAG